MVDSKVCVGCGTCVGVCPVGAISMEDGVAKIDNEVCIKCGACAASCPVGAITVDE
ncbi:MAG: 4Fe-4S binding protein [Clostridia bacterium]|nr:4Fe-4S binding protein [Clostridia bacterium]